MSNLLNYPGVLAPVALIATVALESPIPIFVWMAYVALGIVYVQGRQDEGFEREHPKDVTR